MECVNKDSERDLHTLVTLPEKLDPQVHGANSNMSEIYWGGGLHHVEALKLKLKV